MSLLEDARKLAAEEPLVETCHVHCCSCGANRDLEQYGREDHRPDCPWPAMPKIVAALEAAERLVESMRKYEDGEPGTFELLDLARALRGDEGTA